MGNWKQQVIALLQGLIVEIEQLELPESVIPELEGTYKEVTEVLGEAIDLKTIE